MSKVSIVIPAYNVKMEYMQTCMRSVLNQTYKDIEIIIVDDGSTDECSLFYDEYIKLDNRVKVIHQKNQGVSVARNNGTMNAVGDYIMYVDADDTVVPFMVESAIYCAEKQDADLVCGLVKKIYNYNELNEEKTGEYFDLSSDEKKCVLKKMVSTSTISQNTLCNIDWKGLISRGPYVKLIKKEIAKLSQFPQGVIYGEDEVWMFRLLNLCNRVYIVNEVWYGYLQYKQSSIYRYNENRIESFKLLLDLLVKENKEFITYYPQIVLERMYVEIIILIRYHFLDKECKLSNKEKNIQLNSFIKYCDNKDIVDFKDIYYIKLKLLICICKTGLWIPLFKVWDFLKKTLSKGR